MKRALRGMALVIFLIGACLVPCAGSLHAQGATAGPTRAPAAGETTEQFNQRLDQASRQIAVRSPDQGSAESQIGPDDLLAITVFEAPEMNTTARVAANGEISLELLGSVKASGLTPGQLELVLQELLRRTYMKDPHVGVSIQELQSHAVSVVGAVKSPGVFQIRGTKTVIEMLSMAQGLTDDAGDTVWVTRGAATPTAPPNTSSKPGAAPIQSQQDTSGEIVRINLKSLLESADPTVNVPVHPGDIVRVARAGIVYVVGEVQKPGGFVLTNNENISVLQALALAQGLTRTSAKSRARIIRTDPVTGQRTEIPMDLGKILASKAPDPTLQPKDIVFVPNSSAKSAFYGGTRTVLYSAGEAAVYRW